MLDILIDNLSRLENLSSYVPYIIQLIFFVLWIFIIRASKAKYQASIKWSLLILLVSIIAQLFTLITLAKTLAEYSFMILGVGIAQIVLTKNDNSRF